MDIAQEVFSSGVSHLVTLDDADDGGGGARPNRDDARIVPWAGAECDGRVVPKARE